MANPSLDKVSDAEIVRLCSDSNPDRIVLSSTSGGATVVRVLGDTAVKFGPGVREEEWSNQKRAFALINSATLRVPEPYRFFVAEDVGYLVAEYIRGESFSLADATGMAILRDALSRLTKLRCDRFGSLGAGPARRGPLWSAHHESTATNKGNAEDHAKGHMTKKKKIGPALDLQDFPLVLVHGEIVDRNIVGRSIIVNDHHAALVDWASAGFHSLVLERCTTRMNSRFPGGSLAAVDTAFGIPFLQQASSLRERLT